MTSFIHQVLTQILERPTAISKYTFVLPSKRAGSFLIHELGKLITSPSFAPKVLSIEDFAQDISGLRSIDNITTLFEFYNVYKENTLSEKTESFDTFAAWAQVLLYDFNEIDRYLIDYKAFFGYLANVQEVNHWSLDKEKTPLIENYLAFWNQLPEYYEKLQAGLQQKNLAYQGMVYRKASERIIKYVQNNDSPHVFIGFNALNNAEQKIFQEMLEANQAEVFWDVDEYFLNDTQHDVSLFLRSYLDNWPYYKKNAFKLVSKDFQKAKNIKMVGIPKNIGQAKYVGELLSKMAPEDIRQTAVVLGDESLLLPVLNSLPTNIDEVNITMGFALKNAPVTFLFEHLLKIHATHTEDWYYKDITAIINHPVIQKITGRTSGDLSEKIKKDNLIYLSTEAILEQASQNTRRLYEICFHGWNNDPHIAIDKLQELVYVLKEGLDVEKDKITLEFLYQLHLLFNKLNNLLAEFPHVNSVKSLFTVYKDLVSAHTVDFVGKPFTGLQLMGVLETRVLDFENVILLSVNEGVLPAGKSSNSFIPFDLKCAYKLPTYKEKDAIYSYHFHHLLQRAQNVHLIYNTESDGLNAGEKSRFLLQLEMEKQPLHEIESYTVIPKVPAVSQTLKSIPKTPEILEQLKKLAGSGFSPSALTTYIRNPLDFYKQYVLGVQERDEVEETVAYNTLGTVVHDTLEAFYKPWEGKEILIEDLESAIKETPLEIRKQFKEHYTSAPLKSGKNLLIYEVAKRYVTNFLKAEIRTLQNGNTIKVLQVENKLTCPFPVSELPFPVNLKGTVDRIDAFNGKVRVIDYKTGKVAQNKVEIVDWEDINSDYDKYSKPFQILFYACLMDHQNPITEPVEAGIISFKNLQSGFLKFSKKDKNGKSAVKISDITKDLLEEYRNQLKILILEIFDPNIPFVEKEIKQNAW